MQKKKQLQNKQVQLRNIIESYASRVKVYALSDTDYPPKLGMELPLKLLKEAYKKIGLIDEFTGQNYSFLKEHRLPENFDLYELIEHLDETPAMENFRGLDIDEIENGNIKEGKVYLEVLLKDPEGESIEY